MRQTFTVLVERDENGVIIGSIPSIKSCYAQGETLDEMLKNLREVLALCMANQPAISENEFLEVRQVEFQM